MLNTKEFGEELKKLGYSFYSGVPCSFLKYLINYAINDCEYIAAVNEGDAVATAAGAYIGGRKSVVLMQNSGLTNAISPLTSLNYSFKIPVLGFVSLRGEPGLGDQPQHELMGIITTDLLDDMKISWKYLSKDITEARRQLKAADKLIESNQPFFFVVKKNTFEKEELKDKNQNEEKNTSGIIINKSKEDELPTRLDTLKSINELKDKNTVQLATTGKTGRELYEIEDCKNNLYMVGSMGCISPLGLGLAIAKPDKNVVVLDGDGSVLMRMGALAANAFYKPANLLHILLDNNTYDSTGGQKTVASSINFVNIAAASGYQKSVYIHSLEELKENIVKWKKDKMLTLLYIRIAEGSKKDLGRPDITPYEVKERLMNFIN